MYRLFYFHLADRAYAADAKGLNLRELARVEDKAMALGRVVKLFEVVGPGLRLQKVLRRGQAPWLYPLPWQAHAN